MRTFLFSILFLIAFAHASPMIKRLHVDFYKLLNKYGDQPDDSPIPYSSNKPEDGQWVGSGWNQMSLNAFHSL
ncbi:hypothetical protein PRIPAC_89805 [Pristionchus pacificus]|uniref:Uncharacterized protein n=1 Tax=Pristionchus pacificus TaxID=54126 RepID=A0A2A6B431_PRIPA|nr:hypothetical protein PRIPAC_89805 [Pristionchus pacificus]|eukprot:PDM60636.1 hypothetical protein PRIPAC_52098 [Pristionchus pacificus]